MKYRIIYTDKNTNNREEIEWDFSSKASAIKEAKKLKKTGHKEIIIDIYGKLTNGLNSLSDEVRWINWISV